jgi:phosphoribosylcarboxyaminoimidazole (NCAIR) mutase
MADQTEPHDDNGGRADGLPRTPGEFLGQLRAVTEQLSGLANLGTLANVAGNVKDLPSNITNLGTLAGENIPGASSALRALSSLPSLAPSPGSLTAAQVQAIASAISAQRKSADALQTQLKAFDEQLAVLERIVTPLVAWSQALADLERKVTHLGRDAKPESGQPGPA